MRAAGELGTFEEVAEAAPAHAGTLAGVRALAAALLPDGVEVASRRERSVWWSFGPRKMSEGVLYAMPHAAHVNLGLFRGAALPDPEGLPEGTGKALRHVKLRGPAELDRPGLRALLEAARDERARALGRAP